MTHIAEIYFRAWKKASGEILEVYYFIVVTIFPPFKINFLKQQREQFTYLYSQLYRHFKSSDQYACRGNWMRAYHSWVARDFFIVPKGLF